MNPLEIKLEDRVNRSLISEGVEEGIEAQCNCTSPYPNTLSAGNTQVLLTLIPEAKKMEEDETTVVRGDKKEWLNCTSPCLPAAKDHVTSVQEKDIGSQEGGSKDTLQPEKVVTVNASQPSIIQNDSLNLTIVSEKRDIISRVVSSDLIEADTTGSLQRQGIRGTPSDCCSEIPDRAKAVRGNSHT